jgi:hypothetical protein
MTSKDAIGWTEGFGTAPAKFADQATLTRGDGDRIPHFQGKIGTDTFTDGIHHTHSFGAHHMGQRDGIGGRAGKDPEIDMIESVALHPDPDLPLRRNGKGLFVQDERIDVFPF